MRNRTQLTGRLVPALACLALTPAAALMTGCGGGSDDDRAGGTAATTASTATGASTPTTGTTAADADAAARAKAKPQAVLQDVKDALAQVTSYHIEGTQDDADDGHGSLTADVNKNGSFRAALSFKAAKVEFVVTTGPNAASYIKADEAFWRQSLGPKDSGPAKLLADQWVSTPAKAGDSLDSSFKQLLPSELAYCIDKNLGPVTNQGAQDVDGQPAVVLHDAGGRPATAAGDLYVAASGDALPLRVVQLGVREKGGKLDGRCYDSDDASTEKSDLKLSRFNAIDPITAPRGAKDLATLLKGAGADSTS